MDGPGNDAVMAGIARDLADVLARYARERRSEDQKEIARLHTELCNARRAELKPPESNDDRTA